MKENQMGEAGIEARIQTRASHAVYPLPAAFVAGYTAA